MAIKACKECGAEVSSSAKVCPKCGKKLKHTGLRVTLGIVIIFVGIIAIATSGNDMAPTSSQLQEEKVTMEKFDAIEVGMTYQEVVNIIGEEGTLSTESSYESQSMQIYYWYASNGMSNATISFMNGKVNAKSQIGLK